MTVTAWLAVGVFAAAYVLIATELVHRVTAALGGAVVMLAIGATAAEHAFFPEHSGIDWNVIFLLVGMMLIVSVLKRTGLFEYVAIWAVKRARGRPCRLMVLLILATGFLSAWLDNVTAVLLIAPVTILVCERLGKNDRWLQAQSGVQDEGSHHPPHIKPDPRSGKEGRWPAPATTLWAIWKHSYGTTIRVSSVVWSPAARAVRANTGTGRPGWCSLPPWPPLPSASPSAMVCSWRWAWCWPEPPVTSSTPSASTTGDASRIRHSDTGQPTAPACAGASG